MDIRNQMELMAKGQDWSIWEYKPKLSKIFAHDNGKMPIQNRIKFQLEIIRGGAKLYYLFIGETVVAYAFVSKGGGRCSFANSKDAVIGPYYVFAQYRGNKYSELLIEQLLECIKTKYWNAYEWIAKDNMPSLKCADREGFKIISSADLSKHLRRICVRRDMEGKYYILKKSLKNVL